MKTRPLLDEQCKQDVQCHALGAELYEPETDDDADEPEWGSDPFNILAHREEIGLSNHD